MDIFESLENLNISEECFNNIMSIVEDIVSAAEDNFKNAKNRYDKYMGRIKKVIQAKKENKTLPDEKFADKLMNKLHGNKYSKEYDKASELLRKAQKLPKSTGYLQKDDNWFTNMTKNEKGKLKHENRYNKPEPPALGDPED